MNKKEQQEMEDLKTRLSLKFTDEVKPDLMPPESRSDLIVNGYHFNSHTKIVSEACTSSTYHNVWGWDKTTTKGAKALYSSRILAYKAMRNELELQFAKQLRTIDKKIEELGENQ